MSCSRHSEKWRSKDSLSNNAALIRAVQSGGTYHWHSGNIALDSRFIGVGQQFPRQGEARSWDSFFARLPLALVAGRDLPILQGGDVLVFGDNAFERLGVLVPEQEIRSQLEILGLRGER